MIETGVASMADDGTRKLIELAPKHACADSGASIYSRDGTDE